MVAESKNILVSNVTLVDRFDVGKEHSDYIELNLSLTVDGY